jgi:hypothetical protein
MLINELLTCLQHVHGRDWRPILRVHDSVRAQIKLMVLSSFDGEKLFVIHFYSVSFLTHFNMEMIFHNFPTAFQLKLSISYQFKLNKNAISQLHNTLNRFIFKSKNSPRNIFLRQSEQKERWPKTESRGRREWKTFVRSENFHRL